MQNSRGADSVVFSGNGEDLRILLIRRKYEPFKGKWCLPGGHVDDNEDFLTAAIRELEEETGLKLSVEMAIPMRQRKEKQRDPRGSFFVAPFVFFLNEEIEPVPGDDALEAKWWRLFDIEELAFDHGAILCEALGMFWKGFPLFHQGFSDRKLPEVISEPSYEDLIIFGGSFNPWHRGHLECLHLCPSKEVIVVPDANPFKGQTEVDRCHFKFFKELVFTLDRKVFPGFCGKEEANPTFDWVKKINKKSISLLMGDDSFMSLEKWKNTESLIKLLKSIFVAPRNYSQDEYDLVIKKLEAINPAIDICILQHHDYQSLSSSELRKS